MEAISQPHAPVALFPE